MKKTISSFFSFVFFVFSCVSVSAHCPLCTGAVAGAAVVAKYYGMDLIILGLFVGAFGISTGLWVGRKIRTEYFKFQLWTIVLLSFLLTVIPLRLLGGENVYISIRWFGDVGSMFNKVYWMDRLFFGSLVGGLLSVFAFGIHNTVKRHNAGNVLFPFQGIAFTVSVLVIAGIVVQLLVS